MASKEERIAKQNASWLSRSSKKSMLRRFPNHPWILGDGNAKSKINKAEKDRLM